jgi:hypothetical protein
MIQPTPLIMMKDYSSKAPNLKKNYYRLAYLQVECAAKESASIRSRGCELFQKARAAFAL